MYTWLAKWSLTWISRISLHEIGGTPPQYTEAVWHHRSPWPLVRSFSTRTFWKELDWIRLTCYFFLGFMLLLTLLLSHEVEGIEILDDFGCTVVHRFWADFNHFKAVNMSQNETFQCSTFFWGSRCYWVLVSSLSKHQIGQKWILDIHIAELPQPIGSIFKPRLSIIKVFFNLFF